uniref:G_PROTEIN_RECEP_F1_2 domain-containing protein n=1 Tax=Mesocestoides corti TaxID=53468 RepID=A0A5K3G0L2_MESCO
MKTGATDKALLTNHRPEPHARRRSSKSVTLATLLIIYCSSFVFVSGLLPIFLACHWYAERRRIG